MLISVLANVNYIVYNSGRPKSSTRNFDELDVLQLCKISAGNVLRKRYYDTPKSGGQDFYFISPLISIQEFELSKPNERGMRRADMSKFDMYRIPHNNNIQNIYPKGCTNTGKAITLIESSEEYYFMGPKFSTFQFAVIKGRSLNAYHIPDCVTKFVVEATFDGKNEDGSDIDVDLSLDICYDVSNEVLSRMIGVPDIMNKAEDNVYAPQRKDLKQRLAPQPE